MHLHLVQVARGSLGARAAADSSLRCGLTRLAHKPPGAPWYRQGRALARLLRDAGSVYSPATLGLFGGRRGRLLGGSSRKSWRPALPEAYPRSRLLPGIELGARPRSKRARRRRRIRRCRMYALRVQGQGSEIDRSPFHEVLAASDGAQTTPGRGRATPPGIRAGLADVHEDGGLCTGAPRAIAAAAVRGRWAPWFLAAFVLVGPASAETWRGLTVAPEHRCSAYDRKRDYPYPQSVERDIVRQLGAVYGTYTGTCFASTRDSDIEHIVATSEAHDSGLCAADRATRAAIRPGPSGTSPWHHRR